MDEEQARRVGQNEALFRALNEEIEGINRTFPGVETVTVICECGHSDCADRIEITVAAYERVRRDSREFVVAPGHELPEFESVVGQGDGFLVVQKHPGVPTEIAESRIPAPDKLRGVGIAHWDEVDGRRAAKGEMDATWQRLGDAAGTKGVGVNRVRVAPGKLPTPPHSHGASEECFFVLAGSGLAWQDGEVHEVRPLDCVIQEADHFEHTFVAGPDGLEYLVFGTRHPTEIGWLPRSRAIRIGWPWVEGRDDDPWDIEAAGEPLAYGDPSPRPPNILNVDEAERESWKEGIDTALLATRERSQLAGLHWERIDAGRRGAIPHCHSAEEEVFVILEGTATLELWQRGGSIEETPLRAGHVVARPPGTGISHSFRAGPDGVTMLIYGTRVPDDACWYPRSRKISFGGLGVLGRIEPLDYLDGEPIEED